MSIPLFFNKIKGAIGEHRQKLIFLGVLALVAGISFYLGYIARAESHVAAPVAINCPAGAYMDALAMAGQSSAGKTPALAPGMSALPTGSGAYVASKTGTKYYPVGCAAAKRIKDSNKIFFDTAAEAQAAGLGLAAGCTNS